MDTGHWTLDTGTCGLWRLESSKSETPGDLRQEAANYGYNAGTEGTSFDSHLAPRMSTWEEGYACELSDLSVDGGQGPPVQSPDLFRDGGFSRFD